MKKRIVIQRISPSGVRRWLADCYGCGWYCYASSRDVLLESVVDHASDRHGVAL